MVRRANASGQLPADITRQAVYHDTAWTPARRQSGFHTTTEFSDHAANLAALENEGGSLAAVAQ